MNSKPRRFAWPRPVRLALLVVLIQAALPCTLARSARAADLQAPPAAIDEVQVTGERAGPRLWRVARGDHVLWILGTLGPLPRHMIWRSRDVEAVLDESQQVLSSRPDVSFHTGPFAAIRLYMQWRRLQKNDHGAPLKTVLPAPQYARFEALKRQYAPHDDGLEDLRPMFAALRLYRSAEEQVGLTSEFVIEKSVLSLARKHRVPVRQVDLDVKDPKALLTDLAATPAAAELACLESTMTRLETDIVPMQARARAWALGDVDALRKLPYDDQRDACWSAIAASSRIQALRTQLQNAWLAAAQTALRSNRSTLALQSMSDLLDPNGPLAAFRALGYSVEGP